MSVIGKVLWWDAKDGNGIIIDPAGNEFYFDSSVLAKNFPTPKSGRLVLFEINFAVRGTSCAYRVRIPEQKKRSSLEREFTKRSTEIQAI